MRKLFAVVMMLLLSACVVKPKVVDMAVDFGQVDNQVINFGIVPEMSTITSRTVSIWFVPDSVTSLGGTAQILVGHIPSAVTDNVFVIDLADSLDGQINYLETFGTSYGGWSSATGVISAGTLTNVTITFVRDAANNPILYVNGVVKSLTEDATPVGAAGTGQRQFTIGDGQSTALSKSIDGRIYDVKVYNRILTPEEVVELYNHRCKISYDSGLVFHAMLDGASGLSSFDGATLGTTNLLVDRISGAVGTPAGNPVGYGDDKLSVCSP